ncbi:MAG TPA: gamma-glutamyl-phosphate reductase, partial [Nitrosomonas sp.]|nr:gamma-glutamyl-phosphate reductase [Nitrosomonas sp.]
MEVTNIKTYMQSVGLNARNASRAVAKADTATKNRALQAMAEAIRRDERKLIDANQQDLDTARSKELSSAMIDRLTLSTKGIQSMAEG